MWLEPNKKEERHYWYNEEKSLPAFCFAYVVLYCNGDDVVMWLFKKLCIGRSEGDRQVLLGHGHEA
jgi:hypothetical protein